MVMHRIMAGKLRRYHGQSWWTKLLDLKTLLLNLIDTLKLAIGLMQSLWLLIRLKPDRVFIKGGYVGLPVGIAAWILRIPFIIHESDSRPGLTNRLLARMTPYRVSGFDVPGFINLGNPVRQEVLEPGRFRREDFGITSDKPLVLAVGGSLGAAGINRAVADLAAKTDRFEIIHITGDNKVTDLELPYYRQYAFLGQEMATALQLADVVVSRAGANTLAELASLQKASIIVPHPSLSGDHQYHNAKAMADKKAIIMLPQAEISGKRLIEELEAILDNPGLRRQLEQGIGEFARDTAALDIAEQIINPDATGNIQG